MIGNEEVSHQPGQKGSPELASPTCARGELPAQRPYKSQGETLLNGRRLTTLREGIARDIQFFEKLRADTLNWRFRTRTSSDLTIKSVPPV